MNLRPLFLGIFLFGAPTLTPAQGTLDFSNRKGAAINAPVFDIDGITRLGDQFLGQLYVGTNASALSPAGVPVHFRNLVGTTNGSGFIMAGSVLFPFDPNGTAATVQLRAWESSAGSSYEAALAAGRKTGKSGVIQVRPGNNDRPPFPPSPLIGLQGFSLVAALISSGFGATTPQNQLLEIPVAALLAPISDPRGQAVSFVSVSPASTNGSVVAANATTVFYIPKTGFVGADRFSYVVGDFLGMSNTVYAQIAVLPPNRVVNTAQSPVVSGGNVTFNFTGLPGQTYQVQRATLPAGPWTSIGTLTIQPDGSSTYQDNSPLNDAGFYRAVLVH